MSVRLEPRQIYLEPLAKAFNKLPSVRAINAQITKERRIRGQSPAFDPRELCYEIHDAVVQGRHEVTPNARAQWCRGSDVRLSTDAASRHPLKHARSASIPIRKSTDAFSEVSRIWFKGVLLMVPPAHSVVGILGRNIEHEAIAMISAREHDAISLRLLHIKIWHPTPTVVFEIQFFRWQDVCLKPFSLVNTFE